MPVIEQLICDVDKCSSVPVQSPTCNCSIQSYCAEYAQDSGDQFVFVVSHPLKTCHGVLGITPKKYTEYKDTLAKGQLWIKENCKAK